MTKEQWKEVVRNTKRASKKKRLSKKELNDLMNAQIALGGFKDKENFTPKPNTELLGDILKKMGV
jgi:hypothetical protein